MVSCQAPPRPPLPTPPHPAPVHDSRNLTTCVLSLAFSAVRRLTAASFASAAAPSSVSFNLNLFFSSRQRNLLVAISETKNKNQKNKKNKKKKKKERQTPGERVGWRRLTCGRRGRWGGRGTRRGGWRR